MLAQPTLAVYQVSRFYNEKVAGRKAVIAKTIHECCKIVQDILKEVESQEPRFISTLGSSIIVYFILFHLTHPADISVLQQGES